MSLGAPGVEIRRRRVSPWLLAALALLGLFVGVIGARVYAREKTFFVTHGASPAPYVDLAVGLAYIATGLVAWRRRPGNRVGPLMTAVGFTWFIGAWGNVTDWNIFRQAFGGAYDHSNGWDLFRAALWFEALNQAILVHLILAFPGGHLASRPARLVAGAAYANVVVLGFLRAATFDIFGLTAFGYRDQGVLGLWLSQGGYRTVTRVYQGFWIAILVVVLAMLLRRWHAASRPTRRMLAPVWFAGSVVAVSLAVAAPTLVGSLTSWQVGVCCSGGLAPSAIPLVFIPVDIQQALFWVARTGQVLVPGAFLFGLLRMSLARIGVSDLVRELGEAPPPGALRDALARALGDPSLEVVFWIPGSQTYSTIDGRPVAMPSPGSGRGVTVIEGEGEPLGALVHDPALAEQPDLVRSVGSAARLAMENERLHAEVRAQLEEVRASRARIAEAADAERRRVERDLHDGAQQRLVNLSLALRMAQDRLGEGNDSATAATLEELAEELRTALVELRELARGLHPAILTEEGLGAALESLAERAAVPTLVLEAPATRLPRAVEATAYFVVSEALANVAKHAQASRVTVRAGLTDGRLRVEVADDGVGGADVSGGSGLRGLADRVAAADGRLVVDSPAGRGTRVVADMPCA
ncbi:MAG: sensor histidine kinase [Actinomycetota bacterium]